MSALLLRQVTITDPGGPHHGRTMDIRVENGRITAMAADLPTDGAEVVQRTGLHASPGWVDLRAHFRDPGEEWKQGIANGLDAAAAGGFTAVAVLPSTQPPTDGRAGVEYMLRKAAGHAVTLLPIGALTRECAGHELAELHDQRLAGAVAFSDDQHTVRNSRLMLLALQYVQGLPKPIAPVMVFPNDPDLAAKGMMHEGPMSTRLGMRGLPPLVEHIALARDLALQAYAGGHLHAATISTRESVELVRRAKDAGAHVTASVAAHNLLLDDSCLEDFHSHFKVMPPLRDMDHIRVLRQAVIDGTIDAVVSDHRPEDTEHKMVEFGHAAFGMVGLETAFAVAHTALKDETTLDHIIARFTTGPRAVLGLPTRHLLPDEPAEITLFDPGLTWTCTAEDIVSRSRNTPLIGRELVGRPLGIVASGQWRPHPALR
jgi:dihydroorotase